MSLTCILLLAGCATFKPSSNKCLENAQNSDDHREIISPTLLREWFSAKASGQFRLLKEIKHRVRDDPTLITYIEQLEAGVQNAWDGDRALLTEITMYYRNGDRLVRYERKVAGHNEEGWMIMDEDGKVKHRIIIGAEEQ